MLLWYSCLSSEDSLALSLLERPETGIFIAILSIKAMLVDQQVSNKNRKHRHVCQNPSNYNTKFVVKTLSVREVLKAQTLVFCIDSYFPSLPRFQFLWNVKRPFVLKLQ